MHILSECLSTDLRCVAGKQQVDSRFDGQLVEPNAPTIAADRSVRQTLTRARSPLSAGRLALSDEAQALCFVAGANSIFYGEKLLTTPNPVATEDQALFARLGLKSMDSTAMGTA